VAGVLARRDERCSTGCACAFHLFASAPACTRWQFAFDGAVLAKAIAATFKNRETAIDVAPIAFTPDFTEQASTLAQWTAFRKKLPNTECPETLADVVPFLSEFLLPIARACERGEAFEQRWLPGGPWTRGT
jgi:hypothetical protein